MKTVRPSNGAIEKAIDTIATAFTSNIEKHLDKNKDVSHNNGEEVTDNQEDLAKNLDSQKEAIKKFLNRFVNARYVDYKLISDVEKNGREVPEFAGFSTGVFHPVEILTIDHGSLPSMISNIGNIINNKEEAEILEMKEAGCIEDEEDEECARFSFRTNPLKIAFNILCEADNLLDLHFETILDQYDREKEKAAQEGLEEKANVIDFPKTIN